MSVIDVRAGSEQELCNPNQSAKPALLEANFHDAYKTRPLFLGWVGLAGSENTRVRDWDPPVRNWNIIKMNYYILRIAGLIVRVPPNYSTT